MLQQFTQPIWIRRLAIVICCATLPLIFIGGLVTTTDAGMAVPDWPNTYGYNLFLYPWTTWFAGPWDLFVEHGHRLLAALLAPPWAAAGATLEPHVAAYRLTLADQTAIGNPFIEVEGGGCTLGPNSFDIGKATAGKTIAVLALPGTYKPT